MSNQIEIYKNNSKILYVNVTNTGGTMVSCTGYTPTLSVKSKVDDSGYTFSLTGTTGSTSGSTLTFNIPSGSTCLVSGQYWYDINLTDNNGDVITILFDKLKIMENVLYGK